MRFQTFKYRGHVVRSGVVGSGMYVTINEKGSEKGHYDDHISSGRATDPFCDDGGTLPLYDHIDHLQILGWSKGLIKKLIRTVRNYEPQGTKEEIIYFQATGVRK